jgi:hypothetical protein
MAKGTKELTIRPGTKVIEAGAYKDKGLTSVVIPDSVTTIGEGAFEGNQLTSVVIPDSVASIGKVAFAENQLTSVVIPDSVTTIGEGAFTRNRLTSVVIPGSGTSIGDWAVAWNQLTSVVIPDSVTSIGDRAFYGNILTSVVIPDSVTTINGGAFDENPLTSVTLPGGRSFDAGSFPKYLAEIYRLYKRQGGVYVRQDGGWTLNGVKLAYTRVDPRYGIRILGIDGVSRAENNRTRHVFLQPGWHDIEVDFYTETITESTIRTLYSEGSVTFKQRYLFEDGRYAITGTPEGDQIIFRIQHVND